MKRVVAFSENPPAEATTTLSLNMEDWNAEEKKSIRSLASEISDLPFYEGHVAHGYSLDFVSSPKQCPRCQAPTKQQYANFIYATHTPRKSPRELCLRQQVTSVPAVQA